MYCLLQFLDLIAILKMILVNGNLNRKLHIDGQFFPAILLLLGVDRVLTIQVDPVRCLLNALIMLYSTLKFNLVKLQFCSVSVQKIKMFSTVNNRYVTLFEAASLPITSY